MEGFEKNDELNEVDGKFREEIYSKAVRAGKRTYFFDVKATRKDEYYLTITESKKRFDQEGKYHFEKHKIFLYKEDFEKFAEGLREIVEYIHSNQPFQNYESEEAEQESDLYEEVVGSPNEAYQKHYTDIEFEDLSK
jgi:hypothetical protein